MSNIRGLTLMRLEASGPFLAVHVLFQKLHDIAVSSSALLPSDLKCDILRLSPLEKKELVEKTKKGCTLLFSACKSGNLDVVQFLLANCDINVERRCIFEAETDPILHYVPPLWAAVVSGHLHIVDPLLFYGCDVNGCSNNGSTPLRSACFQQRLEVVMYLVERGAHINRANHEGGTCLMNAVRSVDLCKYLIEKGADLKARDVEGRNVLYYAIEGVCGETVRLLLDAGVDTRVKLGDRDQEAEQSAVQLACLKGDQQMVECILGRIAYYSPEDEANAWELLGATQIVRAELRTTALNNWRRSVDCRQFNGTPKHGLVQRPCYGEGREFVTHDELDRIQEGDLEQLLLQSALITDRILGLCHEETRFRIMRVGAKYADSLQYQRYFSLWRFCLQVRIEQQGLFNFQTCFTAEGLLRVLLDLYLNQAHMLAAGNVVHDDMRVSFDTVYQTFQLLSGELEASRKLLRIRPVFKKQQQNFDRIFKCVTHLIYLMLQTAREEANVAAGELEVLKEAVTQLIRKNISSAGTNDTLLHLAVSRLNFIKHDIVIFPSYEVVALLLECEARVNAQNDSKSTPLHVATTPYNFNNSIIHLLLKNGAHIDLPNKLNDHPAQYIALNPASDVPLVNYSSLKCAAATTIVRYRIPYKNGQLPATLERFVRFHEA